jgi:hypothetical protein
MDRKIVLVNLLLLVIDYAMTIQVPDSYTLLYFLAEGFGNNVPTLFYTITVIVI